MNNELIGFIFIILGMGLLGSSVEDLYTNFTGINFESAKSFSGIVIGISSSIYGYKRMKSKKANQSEVE